MADENVKIIIDAIDRTKSAFTSMQNNMRGLVSQAATVQTAFTAIATAAPVLALVNMIKRTTDLGEELLKMSKQTGIAVENLSAWRYAAEQNETSIEVLNTGMKAFSNALNGVNDEGKDTTAILKALGVTAKDPQEALLQVADAFAKMEDGAGKSQIAVELFGRSGRDLIPLLSEGRAGFSGMADEATRLGVVMDQQAAEAADRFGDNIKRLQAGLQGVVHTIANAILPILNKFLMGWELIGATAGSAVLKIRAAWDWLLSGFKGGIAELKKQLAEVDRIFEAQAKDIMGKWEGTGAASGGGRSPAPWRPTGKDKAGSSRVPAVKVPAEEFADAHIRAYERYMELVVQAEQDVQDEIFKITLSEFDYKRVQAIQWYEEKKKLLGESVELEEAFSLKIREINGAEAQAAWDAFRGQIDKTKVKTEDYSKTVSGTLTDAFEGLVDSASNGFKDLGNVAESVLSRILSMLMNIALFRPLEQSLSGGGGLFASLFGAAKPMAAGGSVSALRPYWVGESGPELFVPNAAGTIVPNGAGGGVNMVVNIENKSSMPISGKQGGMKFDGRKYVTSIILEDLSTGGPISRATGGAR